MTGLHDLILTPRLRLIRPTWEDFDDLFRMHTDPRVMATLGPMVGVEDGRKRMTAHLEHWERFGYGYWIARDRGTNAFLGRGGLRNMSLEGRDETELGYGFVPEAWGRGLATELANETVRVAFEALGLADLICFTLPTNRASRRVMEKVGFTFEREGQWADLPHIFFRLKKSTWPQSEIEILRPSAFPRRFRIVLFDWDGTLSLLREGWQQIMTAQMLEALPDPAAIERIVVGLNGRPTIVQMQALAAAVTERVGQAAAPADYLNVYQSRLLTMIRSRYADIESGHVAPGSWAVVGAHEFLKRLRARGIPVIVISGTERSQVRREIELLRLAPLIDELHAPDGDDPKFHKRDVIGRILLASCVTGDQVLGFGDGVVETEEVRRVGGAAVAVASETPPSRGVHSSKRIRLIEAGADAVIGDFDGLDRWLPRLMQAE